MNCREMKYAYPLHILYTPTPTHLCIFSVKKSVIINCCFMATSAIMDIFQLNQYSGASFIQILMIWMFHLLKTFEWDSIIKCYIKIHYLNALGTKLFLIAMPHCTYFVHNFKTFRRHFSHVRLFFLLDDWKS